MAEHPGHYIDELIALAKCDDDNRDPWKHQVLDDMLEMARAAGLAGVSPAEKTELVPEFEQPIIRLHTGERVRNYPMDLSLTFGSVVISWRAHRGNMKRHTLAVASGLSSQRIQTLESDRRQTVILDNEVTGLALGLDVTPGMLATRRTPAHILKGAAQLPLEQERAQYPRIPFFTDRSPGAVVVSWGEFFGLNRTQIAQLLEIDRERVNNLIVGRPKVPYDLERMTEKMHTRFNLPPGLIYTRTVPNDPGIVLR